jgi:hypothetical protein
VDLNVGVQRNRIMNVAFRLFLKRGILLRLAVRSVRYMNIGEQHDISFPFMVLFWKDVPSILRNPHISREQQLFKVHNQFDGEAIYFLGPSVSSLGDFEFSPYWELVAV